ncbi:dTDP-glucose 4,6-dehydratase [Streptomyces sp. NPDC005132]|uniref:dTDP-glucose 4,6-dehydratase n=1 Tax=Streptomyces sp. NPDC005132 TaxID=3154294 RepID=UPI0033A2442F
MKILVTGGAGFIGSHYVRHVLDTTNDRVTVLDALTYAGSRENLGEMLLSPRLEFVRGIILDPDLVAGLVEAHDTVVHLAAESHVDRSFLAGGHFLTVNVLGTQRLLDAARRFGVERFVHVSTDEVYGPIAKGAAGEDDPLCPTVPYAASKAASDLVALSAFRTHGVPVCVTRSSNNYGPRQHPEKIIPRFVTSLIKGTTVGLHGDGRHVRNWLHAADNAAGIDLVLRRGVPGEVYNLGGGTDLTNRQLTDHILRLCGADWNSVEFIADRTSNDVRYAMHWEKAAALGYLPQHDFRDGLAATIQWYRDHPDRWAPLLRNPDSPRPHVVVPHDDKNTAAPCARTQ